MYKNIFDSYILRIKQEKRYREFLGIERSASNFPYAKDYKSGKQIIMWCSNDYLGMSRNPYVIEAAKNALTKHGVGSGGTRNISGNNSAIIELESTLADLHCKEQALLFTSGYIANESTISTLAKIIPNIAIFSDQSNHASMISGIKNSKADKFIYEHLNMQHLEELLKSVELSRPKIVIFESAYSMDGLFSPIPEICSLAKKYNALTYIDEVHTVGLYGEDGGGLAKVLNCTNEIDIIQGSLAKAYGTIGGYIAANTNIINAVKSSASGFIFTTSLPPAIANAATTSINYLKSSTKERKQHQFIVNKVKKSFIDNGINYLHNDSHIIPIIIGDAEKAKKISEILLDKYNIYIQHINFPTVPKGTERIRITPTPFHTEEMIEQLTLALCATFKELDINVNVQVA